MFARLTCVLGLALVVTATVVSGASAADDATSAARTIPGEPDVAGGLVVHVGCGDGPLTVALAASDRYLVHGLYTDAKKIEAAREQLRSQGVCERASVSHFDGSRLPYVDNLVNLLIAEDLGDVPRDEVMRVLVPRGIAWLKQNGRWTKTVKPWPKEIDDWNHYLHGPDNNAVACDTRVASPRHLQWTCGPLWSRSHEFLSSVSGMISDEGRIFYFFDEGLTGVTDAPVPERWKLIARDGFNGKLLWKIPIEEWGTRGWKRAALRSTNRSAPRRMVAGDGRLLVTLGFSAPVSVIDAATGAVRRTLPGTESAQELRYLDGVLLLRKGDGTLTAIDVEAAETLWQAGSKVRPETFAAGDDMVFYQDGATLCCCGLKDGNTKWKLAEREPLKQMLLHDGRLIVAGKGIRAIEAETGNTLWEAKAGAPRHPMFVVGGRLWLGGITALDLATGQSRTTIEDAAEVFSDGHHPRCYGPRATQRFIITPERGAEFVSITGEPHSQNDWLRGPCTFGVLPCNGLLYVAPNPCFCYTGVKLTGFNALAGAGTRSTEPPSIADADRLQRGPAYGTVSASRSHVAAPTDWPAYRHDGRRHGATATEISTELVPQWSVELGGRLTQPVIAGTGASQSKTPLLLVAVKDAHTLHALDLRDGTTRWIYTAEGRIDSPPTVHDDVVLFGTAAGQVHCLRLVDGQRVWRFQAAPHDQLIVAFDQLESPWRVHGSVLVEQGVAYFTAGRSTNLDGGIRVFGLDPASGEILHSTTLDTWSRTRKDAEDKPFVPAYHMEGAFSDVLVAEGGFIYLGQYKLDLALKQQDVPYVLPDPDRLSKAMGRDELVDAPWVEGIEGMERDERVQREWQLRNHRQLMEMLAAAHGNASLGDRRMGRHVFATSGFLDDSWYNRTYWMYSETWPGFYIANRAAKTGQILCVDRQKTYAVQAYPRRNLQSPLFTPAKHGYLLFADDNENEPVLPDYTRNVPKGIGFTRSEPPAWFQWVPVRIRAMAAARNALFVAGPPDVLDPDDPMASFEGKRGAVLWAVSKDDGQKLAGCKLDAPPVFDGMAAAAGRIYLSTVDGKVMCVGR